MLKVFLSFFKIDKLSDNEKSIKNLLVYIIENELDSESNIWFSIYEICDISGVSKLDCGNILNKSKKFISNVEGKWTTTNLYINKLFKR